MFIYVIVTYHVVPSHITQVKDNSVRSQFSSYHIYTQEAPHVGSAPVRLKLPDFIDCIHSHQLDNTQYTAFITT